MSAIAAAAAAGAASGIANTAMQIVHNVKTREFNAKEAQKQRDFEERMSNTAYQRAIQDIQNAGLNPSMLYASGSDGASTPNSASASASPANMNVIGQIGSLINSINNARALDMKYNKNNVTTTKMYNSAGELVSALVQSNENY